MAEPFPIPPDVPRLPSGEVDVGTLRRTNPARIDELMRQAAEWNKAQRRKPVAKAASGEMAIAKRPPGRARKPAPAVPEPAAAEAPIPVEPQPEPPRVIEREPEPAPVLTAPMAPVIEAAVPEPFRIQLPPDADLEPVKPAKPAPREPEPPALEVALPADLEKIKMIDEYGELDRQMQLRSTGVARFETLKRAIKSWADEAPADAEGIVEGEMYLLRLSARERERKIRDMRALVDEIGIEKFLELATVALGVLEDLIGKTRVQALTVETRSGSRRIKAVPKHPAAIAARKMKGNEDHI